MVTRTFNQLAIWPESILSLQSPKILEIPSASKSCNFYKSWGVLLTDTSEVYSVCLKSLKLSFLSDSIKSVSCNSSMAVLISFTGQAFVVGSDPENFGLLGIADCFETSMRVILPGIKCNTASVGATHVALLDRNGTLYTWGSGGCGELGGEQVSRQQMPMIVASAKIYSVKQVACGPGFTVFCTAGGFLYCFGQLPHCPYFQGKPTNPASIKGLEKLFTQSIVNCDDFIAVLTDSKDVYAVHGCLKLAKLPAKYKSIAGGKGVLFGITKDDCSLHEWKISYKSACKLQTLEAKSYVFDQIFDDSVNIYSGESFSIGFTSLLKVEGFPITKFYSTIRVVHEMSDNDLIELKRQSVSSHPYIAKVEALKKMGKVHFHHCIQTLMVYFNEFKEFSKLKKYSIANKSISALINSIAKVIQRNKVVLESKAMQDLNDFCKLKEEIIMKKKFEDIEKLCQVFAKIRKSIKTEAFGVVTETFEAYLNRIEGLRVLENVNLRKLKKKIGKGLLAFINNLKKCQRIQTGVETIIKVSEFLLKDKSFAVLSNIFNEIKTQINVINHIFFFSSEKSARILVVKSFELWKQHRVSSKQEEINKKYATKTNARGLGMKITQLLKKTCKFAWNSLKHYKKPVSNSKYGLIIVLSSLKKIQSRFKVSSFKAILSESKAKLKFVKILKSLLKKKFSGYFSLLQTFLEERKQYTLLKIILRVSSLNEKLDYKNMVKAFSKFKSFGLANRSQFSERLNRSDLKISIRGENQPRRPIRALNGISPTMPFPTVASPIVGSMIKNNSANVLTKKKTIESSRPSKNVSFTKLINKSNKPSRKGSTSLMNEKDNFETLIDKIFESETPLVTASQSLGALDNLSPNQSAVKYRADFEEDPDVKNKLGLMSLEKQINKLIVDTLFKTFTDLKNFKKGVQRKVNLKFLESSEEEISEEQEEDLETEVKEQSKASDKLWVEQLQSLASAIVKKLVTEKLRSYFKLLV